MKQFSLGIGPCEQQHASAAVVAKFHPEAAQDTLQRGTVHALRHVLPQLTVGQKKERAILAQRERLDRKRPMKINARSMFVQDLFRRINVDNKKGPGFAFSSSDTRKVFHSHPDRWNLLSASRKRDYEQMAGASQQGRAAELEGYREHLAAQLTLLPRRHDPDASAVSMGPFCMQAQRG